MVTALIFAGGVGTRMNSKTVPKQFLQLHGKPILIYTIECFEQHEEVDNIVIVCLESYIKRLEKELKRFQITKVSEIIPGGRTAQESIYFGLNSMRDKVQDDEIVLIHDGVRPLIDQKLISNNIKAVREAGNGITVDYATETISTIEEQGIINNIIKRDTVRIAKAPQSFYFAPILEVYERARQDNIMTVDSAEAMYHYGFKLNTVITSPYNIKITTPSDYYIFKALVEAKEVAEILGL